MLEAHEEYMLAKCWREHDDRNAAQRLVTSHLRLVAKIAISYRGYGLPISEVISEGNIALMQAAKLFHPHKGFPLATYPRSGVKIHPRPPPRHRPMYPNRPEFTNSRQA